MENKDTDLPFPVIRTLLCDPLFSEVLERCFEEEELVEQFTRIYGVGLPRQPTIPIAALVDEATGFRDDQYRQFFSEFIPFVYRSVYLPLYGDRASEMFKGGEVRHV